ncbi:uncharacterized protein VP01_6497g1 [Puccinia sorghi]|uniref:Retrotransposon gag domain-containing protein n=1 Tax=Puccinia sorghi TaxID=27349 RepID=A0A0L6UGI1_9BASI|nr:uncharacterized protein VP01_6497g1 [Puccinia sorghi]
MSLRGSLGWNTRGISGRNDFAFSCFCTPYCFGEPKCQPYLNQIFNGEPLDWTNFLKDLEARFFDHNRQKQAEVALRNICQTRTLLNYTRDFNQHAPTAGWPDAPLMSLYQNGLKENVQLAVVMSNRARPLKASD